MLSKSAPILALGTPSVARLLERKRIPVKLVDRQPLQGVRDHIVAAVEDFNDTGAFRTAIVDPPWYPEPFLSWSLIAGRAVGVGGSVFVSAWPDETRPTARCELKTLIEKISSWADVERDVAKLSYAEPLFERTARADEARSDLACSPLTGELIRLEVKTLPHRPNRVQREECWLRFTVNDYQLALRMDRPTALRHITQIDNANGWHWPFVSARAPCREQIGLWSSSGEVAAIGAPQEVAETLRAAFLAPNPGFFETILAAIPELLSWQIPRPPYRRSIEWQHRQ